MSGMIEAIGRKDDHNVESLADMSNVEKCHATGLPAGTFRNHLLTMRRYRKQPQSVVFHLRCIMTGGRSHPQLLHGHVSGSKSVCKAETFPLPLLCEQWDTAWSFSDEALIPERRQLLREPALGSRGCRVTGSFASARSCDVQSRVRRCLDQVVQKAPRRYKEGRTRRTYSRLCECLATVSSFAVGVHCRAIGL